MAKIQSAKVVLGCVLIKQLAANVHSAPTAAWKRTSPEVAKGPILLKKSKVAGLKIFRENTKQRAIADSYDLNRVTEVACEFCVRP